MSKQDIKRHIETEVPGYCIVENQTSEVVCFNDCDERVAVDPATLVPEAKAAVEVEAEAPGTGTRHVQIYCSPECRNEHYGL